LVPNFNFRPFYEKYKDNPLVFLTHRHADLDAFVSAYALKKLFPHAILAVYEDMNSAVNNLVRTFHIKYTLFNEELKESNVVLVDTRSRGMAPPDLNPIAAVDHHLPSEYDFKTKYLFYQPLAATAEIVYFIYKELGMEPDELTRNLLATAIISDTARFKKADRHTFKVFGDLLTWDYERVLKLAYPEMPKEEKITIAGGIAGVQFMMKGEMLIGYTEVTGEEGTTASILSEIADIAFAARKTETGCRISLRAGLHSEIKVNELAQKVAKKTGGYGGGHQKAAGCSLPIECKEAIKLLLEEIQEK
jgi:nanoRNase/pAp phosphatase (c-di-AMP/oligoRNAs hydrolase)